MWGADSFAELPVSDGPVDHFACRQKGIRLPVLSGLDPLPSSARCLTVADRDVAMTGPGASSEETWPMMLNGKLESVPRVTRNYATLLDLSEGMFGDCCGAEHATAHLRASALRFSERGFRRDGSRLAQERSGAGFVHGGRRVLVAASAVRRRASFCRGKAPA